MSKKEGMEMDLNQKRNVKGIKVVLAPGPKPKNLMNNAATSSELQPPSPASSSTEKEEEKQNSYSEEEGIVEVFVTKCKENRPRWEGSEEIGYTFKVGGLLDGVGQFFDEIIAQTLPKGRVIFKPGAHIDYNQAAILLISLRENAGETIKTWIDGYVDANLKLDKFEEMKDEFVIFTLRASLTTLRFVTNCADLIASKVKPVKNLNRTAQVIASLNVLQKQNASLIAESQSILQYLKELKKSSNNISKLLKEAEDRSFTYVFSEFYHEEKPSLLTKQDSENLRKKEISLDRAIETAGINKKFVTAFKTLIQRVITINEQMKCPVYKTVLSNNKFLNEAIGNLMINLRANPRLVAKAGRIEKMIQQDIKAELKMMEIATARSSAQAMEESGVSGASSSKSNGAASKKSGKSKPKVPKFNCNGIIDPYINLPGNMIVGTMFDDGNEYTNVSKKDFNTIIQDFSQSEQIIQTVDVRGQQIMLVNGCAQIQLPDFDSFFPGYETWDKIYKLMIKSTDPENMFGIAKQIFDQRTDFVFLHDLSLELTNCDVLDILVNIPFLLTTLNLVIRIDRVIPHALLNFILVCRDTLKKLTLDLPKTFSLNNAIDLHCIYPMSPEIDTYSFSVDGTVVFQCSDVQNCGRENHGKDWPNTDRKVDIFKKVGKVV